MRRLWVLSVLVLAGIGACGTPPYGSSDALEVTKLHDVTSSDVAQVILDPSLGPVTKTPVITDNAASIETSLTQLTTDEPGHRQELINALNRSKARGARFSTALCSGRYIDIGGSVTIRSSYPGIATWPASILISEGPVTTYNAPRAIPGKMLQIDVNLTVGGGTALVTGRPLTTQPPSNCSKEMASLLE